MSERLTQKRSHNPEDANRDLVFELPMVEITACIRADQQVALELIEKSERRRLGGDFDSASLIQEALDLLIEKKLVVVRLGKKNLG
jgi:hypothetical protein